MLAGCTLCENVAPTHLVCAQLLALIGNQNKKKKRERGDEREGEEEEEPEFDPVRALDLLGRIPQMDLVARFLMRLNPMRLQEIVFTAQNNVTQFQNFVNVWKRLLTSETANAKLFRNEYLTKWYEDMLNGQFDFFKVFENAPQTFLTQFTMMLRDTVLQNVRRVKFSQLVYQSEALYRSIFIHWSDDDLKSFFNDHYAYDDLHDFIELHNGSVNMLEVVLKKGIIPGYTYNVGFLVRNGASDDTVLSFVQLRAMDVMSDSLRMLVNNATLYPKTLAYLAEEDTDTAVKLAQMGYKLLKPNTPQVYLDKLRGTLPEKLYPDYVNQSDLNLSQLLDFALVARTRGHMTRNLARVILNRAVELEQDETEEEGDILLTLSIEADMDTPWVQTVEKVLSNLDDLQCSLQMARLLGSRFKVTEDTQRVYDVVRGPAGIEFYKHIPEAELIKLFELGKHDSHAIISNIILAERFSERFFDKNALISDAVAQALVKVIRDDYTVLALQLGFSPIVLARAACKKDRFSVLRIIVERNGSQTLQLPVEYCFTKKGVQMQCLEYVLRHSKRGTLTVGQWEIIVTHLLKVEDMSQVKRVSLVQRVVQVFGKCSRYMSRVVGEGEDWFELQLEIVDFTNHEKNKDRMIEDMYRVRFETWERRLELIARLFQ
jgi:hypothetical protein